VGLLKNSPCYYIFNNYIKILVILYIIISKFIINQIIMLIYNKKNKYISDCSIVSIKLILRLESVKLIVSFISKGAIVLNKQTRLKKLNQTALLAALCFVSFTYLQIKIPIPGGNTTSLHIGNAFCVLAALLLGGWYGGLAGAIGMTIADLLDPVYIMVAPKTFILKLCIGLITGLIAHRIAKISENNDKKYILKWSIIASVGGLAFNVVADPIVGFFYKQFILGQPQDAAAILAKISAVTTLVNAIVSTIVVVIIYNVLRPILNKEGLLTKID
jgi:uncharacterized membrane protein